MKKTFLFILSITVAFGITSYIKNQRYAMDESNSPEWKTFVKKSGRKVASYPTTHNEFQEAQISPSKEEGLSRAPSSIKTENPLKGFMVRKNRILTGEIEPKYEESTTDLAMVNDINPDWKEIMGNELMRFQPEDTKLLVKVELPVIQISNGKGRYLEQVIITYLSKNGERNSFKALVDSDTGSVIQTWDRTISEKRARTSGMTMPTINESGITSH